MNEVESPFKTAGASPTEKSALNEALKAFEAAQSELASMDPEKQNAALKRAENFMQSLTAEHESVNAAETSQAKVEAILDQRSIDRRLAPQVNNPIQQQETVPAHKVQKGPGVLSRIVKGISNGIRSVVSSIKSLVNRK